MMPIKIIAIAGLSGGGKTTLVDKLVQHYSQLGKRCVKISVDSYYRANPAPGTNFDLPESVELELLATHLKALENGESVEVPTYCFRTSNRLSETTTITPTDDTVIFLESIFALNEKLTSAPVDFFKLYVDTPRDLSLVRRLLRDVLERGYTLERNANYYINVMRPHLHHVESTKATANYVLSDSNPEDIQQAIRFIDHWLLTSTERSEVERRFNEKTELLQQKMKEFSSPSLNHKYKTAEKLYTELKKAGMIYFSQPQSAETYRAFRSTCEKEIDVARNILDVHTDWKKIALNILTIVLTAGIGYVVAASIDYAVNNKFTFFSTDSSLKIDAIEDSIYSSAPTANG